MIFTPLLMRYTRRKFKRTYRKARTGRKTSYSIKQKRRARNMSTTATRTFSASGTITLNQYKEQLNGIPQITGKLGQVAFDARRLVLNDQEFNDYVCRWDEWQINGIKTYFSINNIVPETTTTGEANVIGAFKLTVATDRNGLSMTYQGNDAQQIIFTDALGYSSAKTITLDQRTYLDGLTQYGPDRVAQYRQFDIQHSIYPSGIIERNTWEPTIKAAADQQNVVGQSNSDIANAKQDTLQLDTFFNPQFLIQVNAYNKLQLAGKISVLAYQINVRYEIQCNFKGQRFLNQSSNKFKDPFKSLHLDPVKDESVQVKSVTLAAIQAKYAANLLAYETNG